MIVLEQCNIDYKGSKLVIEAAIENLSYYNDIYIDWIRIDTDKTYSPNGPSENPVFKKEYTENTKRIRLCISSKDLTEGNFNDNIFLIYIKAKGTPTPDIMSPDTPCGMDDEIIMGVAVNLRPIYTIAMGYIKELDSNCTVSKGFIDMILRMKAFDLSLKTGNYSTAFRLWSKLFKGQVNILPSKNCGCNGTG